MPEFTLRKTMVFVEDIHHDGGPAADTPRRRAAIVALVKNPFAGRFVEDLQSAMEDLKPLGLEMTDRLIEAMGGIAGIDGYGKAGLAGEGANWNIRRCGTCPVAMPCAPGWARQRRLCPRR